MLDKSEKVCILKAMLFFIKRLWAQKRVSEIKKNSKFFEKTFDKVKNDAKLNIRCRWSPEDSGWSGDRDEKEILKNFQKSIWQNVKVC